METTKLYDILELQKKSIQELTEIAKGFKLEPDTWPKQTLIYSILNEQSKLNCKS